MVKAVVALFPILVGLIALGETTLPAGYEEIDGIRSTSGGKQYIVTDYVPSSSKVKIEAEVVLTRYATQAIWCSRRDLSTQSLTLFAWGRPNYFRMDRGSDQVFTKLAAPLDGPTVLAVDYKTGTFSVDGVTCTNTTTTDDFDPASRLVFFASHNNANGGWGNYAEMTLCRAKVYNAEGELERDYVPVRCTANAGTATEYGLYETVCGTYFSVSESTAFTPYAKVEKVVSWTEDEVNGALVFDCNANYTMTAEDAARITSTSHTNFIKRGAGTLIGAPIQAYTGNITVEEGVFVLGHQYDCGADDVGWIRVCAGASLQIAEQVGSRAMTGKTIYTSGNGYEDRGVIYGGCSWNSCGGCRFILEGDSLYRATSELNFLNYIDLAGHTLTGHNSSSTTRWGISQNTITNSAATAAVFDFTGGMFRAEIMSSFKGKSTDGVVRLHSTEPNGVRFVAVEGIDSAWPIEIGPNVSLEATKITDNKQPRKGLLKGPRLTFAGDVTLTRTVNDGQPSIVNVQGQMTGAGKIDVGSGWVNFRTASSDYSGKVTVSRANTLDQAYRSGIRVGDNSVYSAASTTFVNSDLDLSRTKTGVTGPLYFTGDSQCRFTGGVLAGEHTIIPYVHKSGRGELLFSAAVSITDRLEVEEGTVRIPSKSEYMPVVGNPGLMGSVTNVVAWSFESPDKGAIPCVYDTRYPSGTELTLKCAVGEFGPRTTMVRGYIWNRGTTDATWSFRANHNDRIWFWLDGEVVFTDQRSVAPGNVATRTITPGPHSYVLITTASNTSYGSLYARWLDGVNYYDSMPIDFQGRGSSSISDYAPTYDPGDGSLFTIDDKTADQLTDPFWIGDIATAAFAPGTTFDVGGYDYRLPNLEGAPSVINVGTLTIGSKWLLDARALAAANGRLSVSGRLVFAEGCVFDAGEGPDLPLGVDATALAAGIVIARADGGITGMPVLSPSLLALNAQLTLSDEGKALTLRATADKFVRASDTGVQIGYGVSRTKPRKEVTITVYRDGVAIDQRKLGNGHNLYAGVWNYSGAGYYFATAELRTEGSDEVRKLVIGSQMVEGGETRYVTADGDYRTIAAAVASLGLAGGKVYLRPGTYTEQRLTAGDTNACVHITTPVQVIGMTDNPAAVTVTRGEDQARVFTLEHAEAAVRMMTIENGHLRRGLEWDKANGGNIFVKEKGGTIENCVIRNGSTEDIWAGAGGNVALFGGAMKNCRLVGGRHNQDSVQAWMNNGGSLFALVRPTTVEGGILIENCLITACKDQGKAGGAPIGLYGNVKLVNCTIADNIGGTTGGIVLFGTQNALPQIVNCAFYNNASRRTDAPEAAAVYYRSPVYRASVTDNNPFSEEECAAAFVNCAGPIQVNATGVVATSNAFVDAANGEYDLAVGAALIDAGADTAAVAGIGGYDLLGRDRFVKGDGDPARFGAPDIGAFEFQNPKYRFRSFSILVR